MDDWELKSFIRFLAQEWKATHQELMVYQMFAHLVRKAGFLGVDDLIEKCRQTPDLEKQLKDQFAFLEAMLPSLEEASSDAKFIEMLSKLKPTGRPN